MQLAVNIKKHAIRNWHAIMATGWPLLSVGRSQHHEQALLWMSP
jgi:hypothetical protein